MKNQKIIGYCLIIQLLQTCWFIPHNLFLHSYTMMGKCDGLVNVVTRIVNGQLRMNSSIYSWDKGTCSSPKQPHWH